MGASLDYQIRARLFHSNFKSLFDTLERHQPVVFVDRFKVQRDNQGGAANKVDMSLSFFVRKKLDG